MSVELHCLGFRDVGSLFGWVQDQALDRFGLAIQKQKSGMGDVGVGFGGSEFRVSF